MKDLELEVEGMGGKFSAHTGREQTSYYAKVRLGLAIHWTATDLSPHSKQ